MLCRAPLTYVKHFRVPSFSQVPMACRYRRKHYFKIFLFRCFCKSFRSKRIFNCYSLLFQVFSYFVFISDTLHGKRKKIHPYNLRGLHHSVLRPLQNTRVVPTGWHKKLFQAAVSRSKTEIQQLLICFPKTSCHAIHNKILSQRFFGERSLFACRLKGRTVCSTR